MYAALALKQKLLMYGCVILHQTQQAQFSPQQLLGCSGPLIGPNGSEKSCLVRGYIDTVFPIHPKGLLWAGKPSRKAKPDPE